MTSAILKSAISCVKSLQKGRLTDDSLFSNPQNTALASAMSMLSNTANYIESAVNGCAQLFDIEILILCRVKSAHPTTGSSPRHFVLWNTLIPTSGSTRIQIQIGGEADSASPPICNANATPLRMATHERNGTEITQTRPILVDTEARRHSGRNNYDEVMGDSPSISNERLDKTNPTSGKQIFEPGDHYSVPTDIAFKCLCLLLDASGFSSHKHCFQDSSFANLGSKILVAALRKVFEAESECRKRFENGNSQSGSNAISTIKQTKKRKAKGDMIYMDLLPDHLRFSPENQACAYLPLLKLSNCGNPSVIRKEKVRLNIRKPDRNKKSQNFAVLCILFHFTGKDGSCASVLRKYAEEGLSSKGCSRRMKYCAGPNSNCGGFQECTSLKRKLCTFFDSGKKRTGMGTVYPLIKELNGKNLREEEVVVRFGVIDDDAQRDLDQVQPQSSSQSANIVLDQRTIWKKSLISRVVLRAEYGAKIATAILVENVMPKEIQDVLTKNVQKRSNSQPTLDVTQAVVVCDVQLITTAPKSFRYPYAEWYNLRCLNGLKKAHFGNSDVPDLLTDIVTTKMSSLLWHKDMFDYLPDVVV